ncbi:phosphatidylserine/phosphatidylglycerophosphate/cardiolipin synthase family protein [Nocardia sp. CA2R105]|uniref:phosphatidylserine/phosphatidylglycerophosphate/ cardiolipin synthase family protein n=1 Tax=Nocardia coffeae TaxID=2873381 RepID=UPI001CA6C44F|nr:phosphatidylserine/phosphatidylglycerophosphate/cardiolipin synthase family protein [Nocardia coffeae]MBY8862425.1 phosphatidylserine/phosphatidylglycerophosphate/cardiolipin synthase family protein [Nocardia coffeae]
MGIEFVGTSPWNRISQAAATTGPRFAAIAYLGHEAPDLLNELGEGDVIVVNASEEAVTSHSTSPHAIGVLRKRGVVVKTAPGLHAKVIATAEYAVVGSANASTHSTSSNEAVVITDQKSVVREVRDYVNSIPADEITDEQLDHLYDVWQNSVPRSIVPGINGISQETGLLPHDATTVILTDTVDDDLTADELDAIADTVEHARAFPIEPMQLDHRSRSYPKNTILLRLSDQPTQILPPAVVYSPPRSIPKRKTGRYQLIRTQDNHRARKLTAINRKLTPDHRQALDRALESTYNTTSVRLAPDLAQALLACWALSLPQPPEAK